MAASSQPLRSSRSASTTVNKRQDCPLRRQEDQWLNAPIGAGIPRRLTVTQTHAATLPFEAAAFVQTARPKTGTMENVTGLVSRYPELFERILDAFRFNNGIRTYYCHWRIVRADQFGVAQTRPRVFLIFVRKDVAERVGIWSDRAVLTLFPEPTHPTPVSIRAALSGLVQSDADELPYYRSIRRSRLPFLLRQLPRCPSRPHRLKNVDSYFTLVRCSWDHPAPTLVIAGQKPDGLSGAIHPGLDRKFTIPELKRLFSLPEDYILLGTIAQAVDTICNMIAPPVQRAIVESIYQRILGPFNRSA